MSTYGALEVRPSIHEILASKNTEYAFDVSTGSDDEEYVMKNVGSGMELMTELGLSVLRTEWMLYLGWIVRIEDAAVEESA